MINLVDMNIASADACVFAKLEYSWIDEMLLWNSSDYGEIREILLPSGIYWEPDMSISIPHSACKGRDHNVLKRVTLQSDGTVRTLSYGYLGTQCQVHVKRFPYDYHECMFRFYDSTQNTKELILITNDTSESYSISYQHPEWLVEDMVSSTYTMLESDANFAAIRFQFMVIRRPGFVIIHNIIPVSFIILLSMFIPLIPPDSGERLSYAITTFLATVFATVSFNDNIPNNSLCITMISYNLVVYYVLSSVGLIWSIAIVCLSRQSTDNMKIPMFLLKRLKGNKKRDQDFVCVSNKTTESNLDEQKLDNSKDTIATPSRIQTECKSACAEIGWYEVSRFLDKLYFLLNWMCYILVIGWNVHIISDESLNSCEPTF